jgi:DNA-binding phage protein
MVSPTHQYIELTPTQSHIVVLSNMQLMLHVDGADSLSINGVRLVPIAIEQQMWSWQTHRKIGRHVLLIDRGTQVQVVDIECVSHTNHRDLVVDLYAALSAIDERLSMGAHAWVSLTGSRSSFESLIGMTCETLLRTVIPSVQPTNTTILREWEGNTHTQMRLDRIILRDAGIVPLADQPELDRNDQFNSAIIQRMLQYIESFGDGSLAMQVQLARQRLLAPISFAPSVSQLLMQVEHAISMSRYRASGGAMRPTADIALLYERWVWVGVLRALGCDDTQIRVAIDNHGVICTESGVMCAYQRRLYPTLASAGWSRDGRIAIPDVMLWQTVDTGISRALIVDAKCSLTSNTPDASAINDCTAYLRRIGFGNADPDAVVLVHPGGESHRWPSGLVVVGTKGVDLHPLIQTVLRWVHQEI